MLKVLKQLNKQVIISSTLKDEEYVGKSKYSNIDGINTLDYEKKEKYHLLNPSYVEEFIEKLGEFNIILSKE